MHSYCLSLHAWSDSQKRMIFSRLLLFFLNFKPIFTGVFDSRDTQFVQFLKASKVDRGFFQNIIFWDQKYFPQTLRMGASLSNKTNCPNANELFTITQENSRRDSQSLPDTVKFKLKFRKNKFGSSCKLVKDNGANSSRTQNNSLCPKVKVFSSKSAKEKQSPRKVSRRTVFKAKKKSDFRKKLDRMTKEQLVNFMMHIAKMNIGVEQVCWVI